VEDYSQDLGLQVSITHEEITEEGKEFELIGNAQEMKETKHPVTQTQTASSNNINKIHSENNENNKPSDDVLILDDDIEIIDAPSIEPSKRKRSSDFEKKGNEETKKKRTTSSLSVSDYRVVP